MIKAYMDHSLVRDTLDWTRSERLYREAQDYRYIELHDRPQYIDYKLEWKEQTLKWIE